MVYLILFVNIAGNLDVNSMEYDLVYAILVPSAGEEDGKIDMVTGGICNGHVVATISSLSS